MPSSSIPLPESTQLRVAGVVSLVSGLLALPATGVGIVLQSLKTDDGAKWLASFALIEFLASCFVYVTLMRVFSSVSSGLGNGWIRAMLFISGLSVLPSLIDVFFPAMTTQSDRVSIALMVILGITLVGLGTAISRSDDDLFELRGSLGKLHIVTGTAWLTVVCAPLGVLVGVALQVVVAMVLFRAARVPQAAPPPAVTLQWTEDRAVTPPGALPEPATPEEHRTDLNAPVEENADVTMTNVLPEEPAPDPPSPKEGL